MPGKIIIMQILQTTVCTSVVAASLLADMTES